VNAAFARLVAGCIALAASAALRSQGVIDLATMLAPLVAEHRVPALGAAVLVDGKLAALGASGVRRAGHPEAVTTDDLWHLGSCTKAMTAALLATFVEQGSLAWNATVAATLPDLAGAMHADCKAITVQQLLAHRAGLPGGPPADLWARLWTWNEPLPAARTEIARTMLGVAPERAPASRYFYSNAGYMVAGAIVERLGRAPWEDLLRDRVWQPLGITSGGFGAPGDKDATTQPWGHTAGKDGPVPHFHDNPPALGPAGTVHMTLRDWAKYAAMHLGEPGAGGKPLLAAATLRALHTPAAREDYALGWRVTSRPWAKGPILTHSGSNTMWFCVAWLAPEAKLAVLVTCNHGDGASACDAVAAACVRRFRPAK